MLTLKGRKLLMGGFHDHWSRADMDNPAVLLAALNYYHYDFVTLMCGPRYDTRLRAIAQAFTGSLRIYLGREEGFGWAHIVTVTPIATPPPPSEADYRSVLRQLKRHCDLVILGHPTYIAWEPLFETGELDKLLDEGLLDGIQFTADYIDDPDSREVKLLKWYKDRERRGRRTAVVGGWDLHLMKAIKSIPPVLYSPEFIPDGHYEAPCSTRTILFAEENSLEAVRGAVMAGETVVERMPDGRLYGPADLVEFLEKNGYREAIAELDRRRDSVSLQVCGPLKAGQSGQLKVSRSGRLKLPVDLHKCETVSVRAGEPYDWQQVPVVLQRDKAYLPIVWQDGSGWERIWAVESDHPVQLDVLPLLDGSSAGAEVVPLQPFEGEVTFMADSLARPVTQAVKGQRALDISLPGNERIIRYQMTARNSAGVERCFEGHLTFFGAKRFGGDWATIPRFGVDQARFSPATAYGKGREWPGPEEYSAQLQFAWTQEAFLLRASVRDAVHYQPFHGHYMYNADCLQLAIDPLLRRTQTLGNIYAFNLALTSNGPELYRTWSPDQEASPTFQPPKPDVSLGDRFLRVTPWDGGLVYEMTLPWAELAPVQPKPGHRMGVYYIMFNNNGSGHVDTLHWPLPLTGMWTKPRKWGVLTLLG